MGFGGARGGGQGFLGRARRTPEVWLGAARAWYGADMNNKERSELMAQWSNVAERFGKAVLYLAGAFALVAYTLARL